MENLKDIKTIYESPDGGKTVYAREFGSSERRSIIVNDTLDWHAYLRNKNWDSLSEANPAILEALEKLKVLESLCNE